MQIKNNIKTIIKPREQTSAFFLPKHSVCLVYWDPVTLHIREVWSGLILLFQLLLACAFLWGNTFTNTPEGGDLQHIPGHWQRRCCRNWIFCSITMKRIPKPTQVKPNYGGISCIPWHLLFFMYFEGKWML